MKNLRTLGGKPGRGFSLIELLVVIAIIAILAAMIFPASAWINRRKIINKVRAELAVVQTSIELYKDKYNSYPPDSPVLKADGKHFHLSPLYYELGGTTLTSGNYQPSMGGKELAVTAVPTIFSGVAGFRNTTRSSAEDATATKKFVGDLKLDSYVEGDFPSAPGVRLLVCSVQWPKSHGSWVDNFTPLNSAGSTGPNPWRYNSSKPQRNTGSFDLWVDVVINGKTNRINNWGGVEIVATPYREQ